MAVQVKDIMALMESIAPAGLAESWDNPGLQVGEGKWPVENIWIALDPTPAVVSQACRKSAGLLITHHPLIFSALRTIDTRSPIGRSIAMALRSRLAVFSAHTNLDSAEGGLNEELARRIGLKDLKVLGEKTRHEDLKLVFYVPSNEEDRLLSALFATGAGRIGDYTACSFRVRGTGTFEPGPAARPSLGRRGQISQVAETRIETVVSQDMLAAVIDRLKSQHPYETMAYDIYPLRGQAACAGLGRIGELAECLTLQEFAGKLKQVLGADSVRIAGRRDLTIKRVAVCTGSGSSLLDSFLSSDADVFVSGDLQYHSARAVEARGRALVDVGHFASERIVIDMLAGRLQALLKNRGWSVTIHKSKLEKDPFAII